MTYPGESVPAGPGADRPFAAVDALIGEARSMIAPGGRRVLGITGAPGSGKSTLAEAIVDALGEQAALVSLDGFHLADDQLHRLGRHHRKGAADTFDVAGYINLLQRLRARTDPIVYAPVFDRSLEAAIAGAVAVPAETPLIVTEGNYLLLDTAAWRPVAPLLDSCWFVDPPDAIRMERLIARHVSFGRSVEQARDRSYGSDQHNADLVNGTRVRATRVVNVPPFQR